MALRCAVILAAVALAAAGCGTGAEAGDTAAARATVQTLLSLCATERATAALHVLAVPAQRAFVGAGDVIDGCRAVTGIEEFEGTEVAAVEVDGDLATVVLRPPDGRHAEVEAERHGLDWRVTRPALP